MDNLALINTSNVEDIKKCINRGDYIDNRTTTPFIYHCSKGNIDIVKCLVEHGCNITLKDAVDYTGLMRACMNGQDEVVKYLITLPGIDINGLDLNTPLICSVFAPNCNILRILLNVGVDINKENNCGKTALDYAISLGNQHAVELLTNHSLSLEP